MVSVDVIWQVSEKSQRLILCTEEPSWVWFCGVRSTRLMWPGWGLLGFIPSIQLPFSPALPAQSIFHRSTPSPHRATCFLFHRTPRRTRGHPESRRLHNGDVVALCHSSCQRNGGFEEEVQCERFRGCEPESGHLSAAHRCVFQG